MDANKDILKKVTLLDSNEYKINKNFNSYNVSINSKKEIFFLAFYKLYDPPSTKIIYNDNDSINLKQLKCNVNLTCLLIQKSPDIETLNFQIIFNNRNLSIKFQKITFLAIIIIIIFSLYLTFWRKLE